MNKKDCCRCEIPFDACWFMGMAVILACGALLATFIWQDQKRKRDGK